MFDPNIEVKRSADGLGPMKLTLSVRLSLITLKIYLLSMGGLTIYHLIDVYRHIPGH